MTSQPKSSKRNDTLTAVILFLIVFALWQIYWGALEIIKPGYPLDIVLFLAIPASALAVYALFVKLGKTSFRRQGYRKPTAIRTAKTIKLSVAFIAIYITMILAPGLTGVLGTGSLSQGFVLWETNPTPFRILHRIMLGMAYAAILSLAFESIYRGFIFRNLVRHYGFFRSLYAASIMFCLQQVSIPKILSSLSTTETLFEMFFMEVLMALVAGLFLGFFFYKTGWSLLGPITFQLGVIFFLWPDPIIASVSLWWISLTFQVVGYAILILLTDTLIKEPTYIRRKYGLES